MSRNVSRKGNKKREEVKRELGCALGRKGRK